MPLLFTNSFTKTMNDVVLCGAEIEKSTIIQYYTSEGTTISEIVGVLASMLF